MLRLVQWPRCYHVVQQRSTFRACQWHLTGWLQGGGSQTSRFRGRDLLILDRPPKMPMAPAVPQNAMIWCSSRCPPRCSKRDPTSRNLMCCLQAWVSVRRLRHQHLAGALSGALTGPRRCQWHPQCPRRPRSGAGGGQPLLCSTGGPGWQHGQSPSA